MNVNGMMIRVVLYFVVALPAFAPFEPHRKTFAHKISKPNRWKRLLYSRSMWSRVPLRRLTIATEAVRPESI